MSAPLRPLMVPSRYRRKSLSASDGPPSPPPSTFYSLSPSYSPPPSSSPPPRTPYSVSSHHHAHVHGSPGIAFEFGFSIPDIDESLAFDARSQYSPTKTPRESISLPSFSASFPSDDDLPFAFEYDTSDASDGFSVEDGHMSTSRHKTNTRRSSYLIPSIHEWGEAQDPGPIPSDDDSRGTFFSVSAERGRWTSNQLPVRPRIPVPKVTPVLRRVSHADLGDLLRDGTDNAMSTSSEIESRSLAETSYPSPPSDLAVMRRSSSISADAGKPRSRPSSPLAGSSSPIELTSPLHRQLSPETTPATSPAQLGSPLSLPPMSSVSPMSIPLASSLEPVSPLSLTFGLPDDPDMNKDHEIVSFVEDDMGENMDLESADDYVPDLSDDVQMTSTTTYLDSASQSTSDTNKELRSIISMLSVQLQSSFSEQPVDEIEVEASALSVSGLCPSAISESDKASLESETLCPGPDPITSMLLPGTDTTSCESNSTPETGHEESHCSSVVLESRTSTSPPLVSDATSSCSEDLVKDEDLGDVQVAKDLGECSTQEEGQKEKRPVKKRVKRREKEALSSENESADEPVVESCRESQSLTKVKRRKDFRRRRRHEGGPLRKKSRTILAIEDDDDDDEMERHKDISCPKKSVIEMGDSMLRKGKVGKEGKGDVFKSRRRKEDPECESSLSESDCDPTPRPPTPSPLDPLCEQAEVRGMLIESMATSRASSLPVSSLCRSILQGRPALGAQRSERQWLKLFEDVLEDGWRGCGVFGKVESSWKDDSGCSLEAQWFYVPERDDDQERAALIRSMMPRPAKRSETKKYKQYYYRPLEKMSRWDPEDEM